MYAQQSGDILVDDTPAASYPLAALRRQVGVVWQENGLLRGSFRENLLLGSGEMDESLLWEALSVSRMDDFVRDLPKGLDTTISEWGGTLSGGQRQRLAIARAVLRRPPLMVFDEATSNLDVTTELELLRAVLPRGNESTILFITHRLTSASLADRILVVADGTVTGNLPHGDMLTSHEGYRTLWNSAASHEPAPGSRASRQGPRVRIAANQRYRL
jgi:ABC-type multidrug transport system fused ATPase/permease subunit